MNRQGERGLSPVVGVIFMVVITLLLATMFMFQFGGKPDMSKEKKQLNTVKGDLADEELDDSGAGERGVTLTAEFVSDSPGYDLSLTHLKGRQLTSADLNVVLDGPSQRVVYEFPSGTLDGTDDATYDSTESWRHDTPFHAGDTVTVKVLNEVTTETIYETTLVLAGGPEDADAAFVSTGSGYDVSITHEGFRHIPTTDLRVTLDGPSTQETYQFENGDLGGSDDALYDPGEAWTHGTPFDAGDTVQVRLINEAISKTVYRDTLTIGDDDVATATATPTPTPTTSSTSYTYGGLDDLVYAMEHTPHEYVHHNVTFHIEDGSNTAGNSLNEIYIYYPNETVDVSSITSTDEIVKLGIDGSDSDRKIDDDRHALGDVDEVVVQDGGSTLHIGLSGNYNLYEDDTIIIEYAQVWNPESGIYDADVMVNGDVQKDDEVKIG